MNQAIYFVFLTGGLFLSMISNDDNTPHAAGKAKSFLSHLDELRIRLIRSAAVVVIFSVIAFIFKEILFDYVIFAPKENWFITNRFFCHMAGLFSSPALCLDNSSLNIINIQLAGQFMMHLMVAIASGVILAMPYIIWQLWQFVMPGLYENEKKATRYSVVTISLLFICGVLFSYFLIVPLAINFLGTYYVSEDVSNQVALTSYVGSVVSVVFATGLVFELPLLVYFLARFGILSPKFLKKNRKYALVIILILSAIITPPDIFSQILVSIPLLILYEIGIMIAKKVYRVASK